MRLDHRAHGAVEHEDALRRSLAQLCGGLGLGQGEVFTSAIGMRTQE